LPDGLRHASRKPRSPADLDLERRRAERNGYAVAGSLLLQTLHPIDDFDLAACHRGIHVE